MSQQPWRRKILLAAACLMAAGCGTSVEPAPATADKLAAIVDEPDAAAEELRLSPAQVAALFKTRDNMLAVAGARHVEAYRLVEGQSAGKPLDYKIASGPVALSRSMAADLAATLTDPDTYAWDGSEPGEPRYSIRLKFITDNSIVDVLLALDCRILTVCAGADPPHSQNFAGSAPRIIGLVKQLFPDDAAIQALP